jgi:hypothetical protein
MSGSRLGVNIALAANVDIMGLPGSPHKQTPIMGGVLLMGWRGLCADLGYRRYETRGGMFSDLATWPGLPISQPSMHEERAYVALVEVGGNLLGDSLFVSLQRLNESRSHLRSNLVGNVE